MVFPTRFRSLGLLYLLGSALFVSSTLAQATPSEPGSHAVDRSGLVAECGRWVPYSVPQPGAAESSRLYDVSRDASNGDVWAVGSYAQSLANDPRAYTMAMRWDGQSWEVVEDTPSPPLCGGSCTRAHFFAVEAIDGEVWAGGWAQRQNSSGFVGPHLLLARGDESGFAEVPTPMPTVSCSGNILYSIKAFATDDIWFGGQWCQSFPDVPIRGPALTLHWDGEDLEIVETPAPPQCTQCEIGIADLDGVASDDLWAAGGRHGSKHSLQSYVIHWDGADWTRFPYDFPGWNGIVDEVHAVATDEVWFGGSYQDETGYHSLILLWDGTALERVETPTGGGDFMELAPDRVLSLGSPPALWNGTAWIPQPDFPGSPQVSVVEAEATDACDGWVVGWNRAGGGTDFRATSTEDRAAAFRLERLAEVFIDGFESGDMTAWTPNGS